MKLPQFSIRDLLVLTLGTALVCAWWIGGGEVGTYTAIVVVILYWTLNVLSRPRT